MSDIRDDGNWSRGREFFQSLTELEGALIRISADPQFTTFEGLSARIQLLTGLLAYVGPHFRETSSNGVVVRGLQTQTYAKIRGQIDRATRFYNSRHVGGRTVRDQYLSLGLDACGRAFLAIRDQTARMSFDFGAGGGL